MSVPVKILSAFKDVKRSGSGFVARCAAHEDDRHSLSIGIGDNGGTLVKCHAGCETSTVMAAAGMTMADLMPEQQISNGIGKIVCEYDYCDSDGALQFQVVRLEPKAFRARRPNGQGKWTWSMKGIKLIPYGLQRMSDTDWCFVTEGEKDALGLICRGLPATTNPFGAGKWRDSYTAHLKKIGITRVVLLPDNDAPGLAHMQQVATSCAAAGMAVKMLALPDLPPKGDVTDWLAAGHTPDELQELVDRTRTWTAAATVSSAVSKAAIAVCMQDVQPSEIDWLWFGRLARGKIGLFVGDGGIGKSTIALDAAARLSRGMPWPDGTPGVHGATILLSAEDDPADTIRPQLDRLGADPSRVYYLQAVRGNDGSERMFSLARDLDALEELIASTGAVFVIIDPLSAYLGGDADSYKDSDVRALLAPLAALAARRRFALLGIMHLRKGDAQAQHRILGSVAFGNAARLVLGVGYADPNKRDSADLRYLVPLKQNICAPAPTLAFSLPDGHLTWESAPVENVTADQVLNARGEYRDDDVSDAEALVDELLQGDDWPLPAKAAEDAARAHGVNFRSVQRAARKRHVQTRRANGRWFWHRPSVALSPCVALEESGVFLQGDSKATRRQVDADVVTNGHQAAPIAAIVNPNEDF